MAATDREPLTLDASAEEAASAPAGLAAVRLALAAGEEVRRFAGELGRAVPPAARVSEPLLAPLAAALWSLRSGEERRGLALLVADDDAARELAEAASWYLPGDDGVGFLPSRGVAYGSGLDPAPHLVGERARALELLARGGLVVVSADALAERVPPRDARPEPVDVALGQQHDRDALVARLVEAGYERRDAVDDRGQLAVRGDIVDVFPTTGQNPLRIELFGDEVERLSAFSLFTQRSLTTSDSATIYPAAERLVAAPDLEAWTENGERTPVPRGLVPVLPELAAFAAVAAWEPGRLREEIAEHLEEVGELLPPDERGRAYVRLDDATELIESAARLDPLQPGAHAFEAQRPALSGRGLAEAENELRGLVTAGLRVLVTFPHRGDAERALLGLRRIEARLLAPDEGLPPTPGVAFGVSPARRGFVSAAAGLAVLPSTQVFRRRVAPTGVPAGLGRALAAFTDLRPGDYVVHEDHGIGRFLRFDTKTVAGVTRDYVELQFRGEDKLFVPHDQLAKVSRYIGADRRAPSLSKLGGKAWQTLKSRARVAVRELAGELLSLYARRQTRSRPPYGPDDAWMERLEAAFPYAETEDQARAIEAVREDLEADRPMDRLVCGDVGFGKTEVALRAAFKVVTQGRQVLMLVPTTILAQQHGGTFEDRYRDFPVRVETISRLRPRAEVRQVLRDYTEGKVDVLIGTHRVLSRDVIPRNLGLVLLDEEQRFGVAQKELLRQLRLEVDVLSLSATPIPRTLHMSLAGLRDISVIATPPRNRKPIRTHVGEWDEELVARAIKREHERGGQTFFLHNRVETIDEAAEKLRRLVPEVRVGVGHGQMAERELEDVMLQFLRGDQDVLVSTTIIESGLDIPQANTLVVERADALGLAQLYQIRGRVGRSDVPAHAYLFYPDGRELSPEARGRLATLGDYTELGSGYRVALRDLEQRGAGNLLGDEQSGHVAAVGFELYCELLAEAVAELGGAGTLPVARPVRVDAQVDAYVPAAYVPLEAAKVDVHRRIALARSPGELRELLAELADRFGPVPGPVENLVAIQEARLKLAPVGADYLSVRGQRATVGRVVVGPAELRAIREELPTATYRSGPQELSLRLGEGQRMREALELVDAIVTSRRAAA
jgi:transcription-repair coupling factor (superfamily II helicase)